MTDMNQQGSLVQNTEAGVRLSKRVAEILKCSRSEAEQVIVGGWVKVNDQVVD
jgi:23S rRNA pseudouridine2604 synthase